MMVSIYFSLTFFECIEILFFTFLFFSLDDEDSGEDEDIPTRNVLKKQSQQIIESKTRRRPGKRKKKSKM